jgi:hypothetical protein
MSENLEGNAVSHQNVELVRRLLAASGGPERRRVVRVEGVADVGLARAPTRAENG